VRDLIDCDKNMLAMPVRPISSVMMPIAVVVLMPVWVVPVIFLYDHGFSFSNGSSSDYGPEDQKNLCVRSGYHLQIFSEGAHSPRDCGLISQEHGTGLPNPGCDVQIYKNAGTTGYRRLY
jgi:hypothetical protein